MTPEERAHKAIEGWWEDCDPGKTVLAHVTAAIRAAESAAFAAGRAEGFERAIRIADSYAESELGPIDAQTVASHVAAALRAAAPAAGEGG